jgi:hypothetical protein
LFPDVVMVRVASLAALLKLPDVARTWMLLLPLPFEGVTTSHDADEVMVQSTFAAMENESVAALVPLRNNMAVSTDKPGTALLGGWVIVISIGFMEGSEAVIVNVTDREEVVLFSANDVKMKRPSRLSARIDFKPVLIWRIISDCKV